MLIANCNQLQPILPTPEALSIRAELLERGGSMLVKRFMAELQAEHLRGEG